MRKQGQSWCFGELGRHREHAAETLGGQVFGQVSTSKSTRPTFILELHFDHQQEDGDADNEDDDGVVGRR